LGQFGEGEIGEGEIGELRSHIFGGFAALRVARGLVEDLELS